ncbi:MAG: type II toxin-antitoxin system ParD family antitoxin, partial [Proteobacteria bacterium]|nr:type II toxin-antitoxin system ParD family antitoxin [Pseudomonadota bacterium]
RVKAARLEELRRDIRDGLESGMPATWDPEEVKREGLARRQGNTGTAEK